MFKVTQSPFSLKELNSLECGPHSFSLRDRLLKIFISGMSLSSSVGLSFVIIAHLSLFQCKFGWLPVEIHLSFMSVLN